MENELENIAERGICYYCGNPNLLGQPRRNLFRCGWCGLDFEITEALNLTRLTDEQYKKVMRLRNELIKFARRYCIENPVIRKGEK